MFAKRWLGAGGVVALIATAAAGVVAAQMSPADSSAPPSNDAAGAPTAPQGAMAAPNAGVDTTGVRMSADQMPPDQVKALQAGDNQMVTNGPVPDTAANRAKYQPLSHAGKVSAPNGN